MAGQLKRPLLIALASGAVLLVLGRAFAFAYTESAWYTALGARTLWTERFADTVILYGIAFVAAAAFALLNFSAVRHSIISLVLPRRLGNVEFAEAVAPRRLDAAAVALALGVATLGAFVVPHWTSLALVRARVGFNESDPYHQLDLGFYFTWLPLEMELQRWAWVVVLATTLIVVALYALTPGLRWESGAVRMTGYVRRHLSTLVAIVLLMLAWRSRVASFTLLYEGSGPDGAFTAVDHRWLLPANVILGIGSVVGAALFLWGAWSYQVSISFAALTAVLLLWLGVRHVLPLAVRPSSPTSAQALRADAPYAATREAFTRRAFQFPSEGGVPAERASPGAELARSAAVVRAVSTAHFAPGARGYVVVGGEPGAHAPQIASATSRLAHAWQEQDSRLLGGEFPRRPAILRVRDVPERVRRLAPVFVQGTHAAAVFRADTLYWMLHLYTASEHYPLSRRFTVGGERRGYFRHAATAYVHGTTGGTILLLERDADPLARAWQRRFPRVVRTPAAAPEWLAELALEPILPVPPGEEADRLFRERVRQLYVRMRAALSASDLALFAEWFDSLGTLLRGAEPVAPDEQN